MERIKVFHRNLKRTPNSEYRSECPFCLTGVLPMNRYTNIELSVYDNCLLCGTEVTYMDIEAGKRVLTYKNMEEISQ